MNTAKRDDIKNVLVSSKEVLQILEITRARLSQLGKSAKLSPIKKNIYLLNDVLERKKAQENLRLKYYRPSNMKQK